MRRFALILILQVFCAAAPAQLHEINDVKDLIEKAGSAEPDTAIYLFEEAMAKARETELFEDIYTITEELTTLYENKAEFDKARQVYLEGIAFAQSQKNREKEARFQSNLGIVEYYRGDWEQSIARFEQALEINKQLDRKEKVADIYANLANLYQFKGMHIQSVDYYLKAIEIFEEIGLQNGVGSTMFNLGNLYYEWGEDSLAYAYYLFAEDIFRREKDSSSLARTLTSKSINQFDKQQLDSAELILNEALIIFQAIGDAHGTMHTYAKLGAVYNKQGKIEMAERFINKSLQMAEDQQNDQNICWGLIEKTLIEKQKGNFQLAKELIEKAQQIALDLGMNEFLYKINEIESELYAHFGYYEEALEKHKEYTVRKDSLFNEKKNSKIAELRTVYETEKKDKEIALLEKNAAVSRFENSVLGFSLGTLLLIGLLLFNQQRIKRRKDQQIFHQQKRLQEEQLKVVRMERRQLAQELNSQVLNFCRKNEFLQSLKTEIDELQEEADSAKVRKLIRKIDLDLKGDSDWDVFLSSFSQVHPGFTHSLTQHYEGITSYELRLASLMKMNLSGKDIASLLNISVDSVKKARHRLRKKLSLDPEINLQEFFLRLQ